MDPIFHKILMIYISLGAGILTIAFGIYLLTKGGQNQQSSAQAGLFGTSIKVTKVETGIILCLFGLVIILASIYNFPKHETNVAISESESDILEYWLENVNKLNGSEPYHEVIDSIVGENPVRKFRSEMIKMSSPKKLLSIANEVYGSSKYWKLIAAINVEKIGLITSNQNTIVPTDSFIEVWRVSNIINKNTKTIVKVSGPDIEKAYNELLSLSKSDKQFSKDISFEQVSNYFKKNDLELIYNMTNVPSDIQNIGELSLKYYGSKKYWPIIAWTNKENLRGIVADTSSLLKNEKVNVLVVGQ